MIVKITETGDEEKYDFLVGQLCEVRGEKILTNDKKAHLAYLLNRTVKKRLLMAWGNYYESNHMFIQNGIEYDFAIPVDQCSPILKEKLDKILNE